MRFAIVNSFGEDPEQARADVEALPAVARARAAGLTVNVRVPFYADKTWKGATPGNPQIYPGWLTPEDHPAMFGIGPGIEQNTHKIGECMDSREMSACIAFLAGYPGVLRGGT